MSKKDKTVYELDLHDSIRIIVDGVACSQVVTRVPGGWLYKPYELDVPSTFVPYSNEKKNLYQKELEVHNIIRILNELNEQQFSIDPDNVSSLEDFIRKVL